MNPPASGRLFTSVIPRLSPSLNIGSRYSTSSVSRFFSLIHKLKHEQKPIVQRFDVDHHHHHKSLSAVAEGLALKSSSIIRKLNQEEPNHPTSDFLVPFDHRDFADELKIALAPIHYTASLASKNVLGKYADALQAWFQLPSSSVETIKSVTVMLLNLFMMQVHSSLSLILWNRLDDIEDGSTLRRGQPAAHVLYGTAQTVNTCNYGLTKAFSQLELLSGAKCRSVFIDEVENIGIGQGLELYWRFHERLPSINEYIVMVDHKTGASFRFVTGMFESEASVPPNPKLLQLTSLMGRHFQIRDDYYDLTSDNYTAKKGFCHDLSEGKFSLPLIHLLQHSAASDRVWGLLFRHKGELSPEMKMWVLSEMKAVGSLDYVSGILEHLHENITTALEDVMADLGRNKQLEDLIGVWT
ncbi:Isoprenoid synthase domain containing protein [Elaphomyces granulatus]